MIAAAIAGLGQVSAAGSGIDALRSALAAGRCAMPSWLPCDGDDQDRLYPLLRADETAAREVIEPKVLRRLDAFSARTLTAALLAWREAGLAPPRERVGIALASGYGELEASFEFFDAIIDKGDRFGSPILFASSGHGAPTSAISTALDVRGPTLTVTGRTGVWAEALSLGIDWLRTGETDLSLVVSADTFHRTLGSWLLDDGLLAPDGRLHPLDFDEPSYLPGETFSALLLGRPGETTPRYGFIEQPRRLAAGLEGAPRAATDATPGPAPLFLCAAGLPSEGPFYQELATAAAPVSAYSPIWGAGPTAEAMTALTAALTLTDGRAYPTPVPPTSPCLDLLRPGPLARDTSIRCVALDARGEGTLVTLHGPDAAVD